MPFILRVPCSAIPEELLESELFGHEKGAFTGAISNKPGLFQQAHNGTLFLDEIAEMSVRLQPKLLRALETMEIQPLGGTGIKKIDARIHCVVIPPIIPTDCDTSSKSYPCQYQS